MNQKKEQLKDKFQKTRERISRFRPIDDTFFEKIAEDSSVCEEILRVILQDNKLKVIDVIPQKSIKNLQGRSVRLDALCIREDGSYCNIEIQRSNNENHLKRARYHSSCITANVTDPGVNFDRIPDVSIIYISEFDVFKLKRCIYHVEPAITETKDILDNGLHEIFVNTAVDDGSEIAELMSCFLQTEINNDKFPKLTWRTHYLKHDEEGLKIMCAISEEFIEEGRKEGKLEERKNAIAKMLKVLQPEEIIKIGYDSSLVNEIANSVVRRN